MLAKGPRNRYRRKVLISNVRRPDAFLARSRIKNLNNFRTEDKGEVANSFNFSSSLWRLTERVVLIFSIIAFLLGIYIFKEEASERKRSAINTAWSNISTPSGGNSGKREAVEYLVSQGVDLWGLDLSCQKMNAGWDDERKFCSTPVTLIGLQFSDPNKRSDAHEWLCNYQQKGKLRFQETKSVEQIQRANFSGANLTCSSFRGVDAIFSNFSGAIASLSDFSGADLRSTDFSSAELYGSNFSDSQLSYSDFSKTKIEDAVIELAEEKHILRPNFSAANLSGANFKNASIVGSIFRNSNLRKVNFTSAIVLAVDFKDSNLSGANFVDAEYIDGANFSGAWAWSDEPPIGLPESIGILRCRWSDARNRDLKPDNCVAAKTPIE